MKNLNETLYIQKLVSELDRCCDVSVTEAQLEGFMRSLKDRNLNPGEGTSYFQAEAQILKVCFGCVEKDIHQAQANAAAFAEN